jgi:cytochrome bd-type quinol oxidase subunit 1
VKIIYTTHYEISQTELNNNFTLNNWVKIISNLSNPIEIYHNLKGNYIVYETIGILYAYPLDIEKLNNFRTFAKHSKS